MDRLERRACEVGRVSTREEKLDFFGFSQLRLTCCRFPADQATLVQGLWTGGQRRGRAPVLHFEFLKKYEFSKTLRFYIFEKI